MFWLMLSTTKPAVCMRHEHDMSALSGCEKTIHRFKYTSHGHLMSSHLRPCSTCSSILFSAWAVWGYAWKYILSSIFPKNKTQDLKSIKPRITTPLKERKTNKKNVKQSNIGASLYRRRNQKKKLSFTKTKERPWNRGKGKKNELSYNR